MDVAVKNVIYDDEHLHVIWHPGSSDFVLITFGDLVNLARGDHFYAERPVINSGFNCFGLMAKTPNWFPAASVFAAFEAASILLAPFQDRVMYGESMGDYGALKYSRAFDATLVIAYCPQWSIDKAECGSMAPGWTEHCKPSLKNMGIQPEDISGRVYLFADTGYKTDYFHATQISAAYPQTKIIDMPNCGHNISFILVGTQLLSDVIDSAQGDDVDALKKIATTMRRKSGIRNSVIFPYAASFIFLYKDVEFVLNFLRTALPHMHSFQYKINDMSIVSNIVDNPIHLITHSDTVVLYDNATGRCRHVAKTKFLEHSSKLTSIAIRIMGRKAFLTVDLGGLEMSLYNACRISGFMPPSGPDAWETTVDDTGEMLLSYNGRFLPGGQIACDRPVAHGWEKFTFSDVPRYRSEKPGKSLH